MAEYKVETTPILEVINVTAGDTYPFTLKSFSARAAGERLLLTVGGVFNGTFTSAPFHLAVVKVYTTTVLTPANAILWMGCGQATNGDLDQLISPPWSCGPVVITSTAAFRVRVAKEYVDVTAAMQVVLQYAVHR